MIRPVAIIVSALASSIALLLFVSSSAALAASPCKGLAKGKCESSASCSWVSGYTTDKGKKISAYCRAKSGKSSKSSAKTSKKTDTSKKADKKTSKSSKETKKSSKSDKDKKAKSKESKDSKKK